MYSKTIGIVGGVGPYAGINFNKKIFDQTIANSDQDHLPIILDSEPGKISDRTKFLIGKTDINPGYAIADIILKLEKAGAQVISIPCNTSHAKPIFKIIEERIASHNSKVNLLNMINCVTEELKSTFCGISKIGVLATTGTIQAKTYHDELNKNGFTPIEPDSQLQKRVHRAIYKIKQQSNPIPKDAEQVLREAIKLIHKQGAEAIVLGCTELSLVITESEFNRLPIIDPVMVLARATIKAAAPNQLKPLIGKENQYITNRYFTTSCSCASKQRI